MSVTILKKEYAKLVDGEYEKKRPFNDAAFGILRGSFKRKSSVFYVAKMRKAWRD